jgi:hydrogenase small subunit
MKSIDRRRFLHYALGSAAALGLEGTVLGRLRAAHAAGGSGLPTVLWLAGGACTGCTISLANRISSSSPRDVGDLLLNTIDLRFHPNLMGAAGQLAVDELIDASSQSGYVLAIEGSIPTAFGGHACVVWSDRGRDVTMMEAVQLLAPGAAAVLAIGTCASFGGVSSAYPNPCGGKSVRSFTGRPAINLPGCPTHPDWIVWTIAQLLAGVSPALDSNGRPTALYARSVHDRCPRKGSGEAATFAVEGRCLKSVGCKGPQTRADCPTRLWNGGSNWCIGANAECIGCTEPKFPDGFGSIYKSDVV